MGSWIGVDLDGTLAHYESFQKNGENIGPPVSRMLDRVKLWAPNNDVRIFTARASDMSLIPPIEEWCRKHIGRALPVTNVKDFGCIAIYDDRAHRVSMNKGLVNHCEHCGKENHF